MEQLVSSSVDLEQKMQRKETLLESDHLRFPHRRGDGRAPLSSEQQALGRTECKTEKGSGRKSFEESVGIQFEGESKELVERMIRVPRRGRQSGSRDGRASDCRSFLTPKLTSPAIACLSAFHTLCWESGATDRGARIELADPRSTGERKDSRGI